MDSEYKLSLSTMLNNVKTEYIEYYKLLYADKRLPVFVSSQMSKNKFSQAGRIILSSVYHSRAI